MPDNIENLLYASCFVSYKNIHSNNNNSTNFEGLFSEERVLSTLLSEPP